jgi:hypothetical protein
MLSFDITEDQIFSVKSSPAGLLLSKGEALGVTHDLAHACMAEQMWVHWRRLADRAVAGCAQGQYAHIGPF